MAYSKKLEKIRGAKKIPPGYESEEAFLKAFRESFDQDVSADSENRQAAREDYGFVDASEQWDSVVAEARQKAGKPVMTINRIPAFIGQVFGNRLLNETSAKVLPDGSGDKEVARVRAGIIRAVEKNSSADRAYNRALMNATIGGDGAFYLDAVPTSWDVFEQELKICPIHDNFSVVWDRMSTDPTGRDAKRVTITYSLPLEDFKRDYSEAYAKGFSDNATPIAEMREGGWYEDDQVRICRHYYMSSKRRVVAMMQDGDIKDITDDLDAVAEGADAADLLAGVLTNPATGEPMVREVDRPYCVMVICSGNAILEAPVSYWLSRVPVFRCTGWEIFYAGKRVRWGLVRFLKDPQRLHNLWRSIVAEKLIRSPKALWVASSAAVQGREDQWRNSHLSDNPLLVYNAEAGERPDRVDPVQIEPALIQEAGMAAQDLRDVSNIHEASLGQQSNEVSGKAIVARQRVGELGVAIYVDSLNMAIEECAKTINEMIPYVYDTVRTVKVVGDDGKEDVARINDPNDENSPDITAGRYTVTITTGPSYTTKRVEAAEAMLTFVNAAPQVAAVAADLIVAAQDWPDADKIAARLKQALPPNLKDPADMPPEEQQAAAQSAQQQQAALLLEFQTKQAEAALKQAQAQAAQAQALEAAARARATIAEIGTDQEKLAIERFNAETQRLVAQARAATEHTRMVHDIHNAATQQENTERDREAARSNS